MALSYRYQSGKKVGQGFWNIIIVYGNYTYTGTCLPICCAGVCMTLSDCNRQEGMELGGCASGFGVCCGFMASDGRDVTMDKKVGYIKNPNFPRRSSREHRQTVTLVPKDDDVSQILIEFEQFEVLPFYDHVLKPVIAD